MYHKKLNTIERKEIYKNESTQNWPVSRLTKSCTKKHFFQKNKAGKCTTFHVGLLVCHLDNCYAIMYP